MKKTIELKNGTVIPRLGQGTWHMGEKSGRKKDEIEALRKGIELGMTLIDTAEMYGDGASERLIGEAIRPVGREKLYLVSKVYPHNAGKGRIQKSLDNSLKRLGTEYLDLYLLHWRGSVPLAETAECMERLVESGKIRSWGVSNLDIDDMEELLALPNGSGCQVDQVLYHLGSRGVEYSLLPWLDKQGIPLMAYCPIAQGGSLKRGLYGNPVLQTIAEQYGVSESVILLNFILQNDNVFAIPKASAAAHVEENRRALEIDLTKAEMEALDRSFPAPRQKVYLDIV